MKLKIFIPLLIIAISSINFAEAKTVKKVVRKPVKKLALRRVKLAEQNFTFYQNTPFVYQITGSNWSDPIFGDACEEATVLMATGWYRNQVFSNEQVHAEIIKMADYQTQAFGSYKDSSATDTATLLREVYGVPSKVSHDISVEDLIKVLARGNIAIIPIDGQRLDNPYYSNLGPPRHMLVVTAYDPNTNQFAVNDPGTHNGKGQIFSAPRIQNALQDYQTGNHIKVTVTRTAMIEVSRNPIEAQ